MAESPKNEETESAPVIFLLNSVVRGRSNRTARAAQPGRMSFVQRLAGGTILVRRARPARITEAALIANIEEIKLAVAQHKVVVTTLSGQVISLETLEAAPAPAEKPLPNPPLDSANNDKNQGIGYDVPPTPEGTTMNAEEPELLKGSQSQEAEEAAVEPPHAPPPGPFSNDVPEVAQAPEHEPVVEEAKPESRDKKFHGKGKRG